MSQIVKDSKPHPTNTVHYACFACRVAFKQPNSSNWNVNIEERPFDCPNCKQPMIRLGKYFKAPPKRAIRQWLKVELLFKCGERFFAGNSGLSRKCDTLPSTVAYLVEAGRKEPDVRMTLTQIRELRRQPTASSTN